MGYLMVSYFIVAHCTFTTNFSSKLKSQFQVIFGQDFCLLANGWWNTYFYHYCVFTKRFPISSRKRLICHKIFLFCWTDSFCGLPWLFCSNHQVSNILFHMLADGCFWILPVWSHIWYFWISFFLHLDGDSAS